MTWLLVLVLLHADGTVTETKMSRPTAEACNALGRAIVAQVNHSDGTVAQFTCTVKGESGRR